LKRLEDFTCGKIAESCAGKLLDQKTKHDETEIAIQNSFTNLVFKRFVCDHRERAGAFAAKR